jgi:hypothetical protein
VVRRSRMSRVSHDHTPIGLCSVSEWSASTLGLGTSEEKKLLCILLTSVWGRLVYFADEIASF